VRGAGQAKLQTQVTCALLYALMLLVAGRHSTAKKDTLLLMMHNHNSVKL
jgi:hypothetical protein